MSVKRVTYTAEFKLQAVRRVLDGKLSLAEVARQLGIAESRLYARKKAFLKQGEASFLGSGRLTPFEEERRRLKAEVKRL